VADNRGGGKAKSRKTINSEGISMNWRKDISQAKVDKVIKAAKEGNGVPCPECDNAMTILSNRSQEAPPKPEAYCGNCHLSVPLFKC